MLCHGFRLVLGVLGSIVSAFAADFVVTTAADSGPGSLRQALLNVNSAGVGTHRVLFHIPGTSVAKIRLQTALPNVRGSVRILGESQPGNLARPQIVLDGGGTILTGLRLEDSNQVEVSGLAFIRFNHYALVVHGVDSATIRSNWFGIDAVNSSVQRIRLGAFFWVDELIAEQNRVVSSIGGFDGYAALGGTLAFNQFQLSAGFGVCLSGQIRFQRNRITGTAGLPVDATDAAAPVLTSATATGFNEARVFGTVSGASIGTGRIEFYAYDPVPGNSNPWAQYYLGATDVVVSQTQNPTDFSIEGLVVLPGKRITAIWNDAALGFSRLSAPLVIESLLPVVHSVTPNMVERGQPAVLSVTGENFIVGAQGRIWRKNFVTTVESATRLSIVVPADHGMPTGQVDLRVFQAGMGGGWSSSLPIHVQGAVPVARALTPAVVTVGVGSTEFTLDGEQFDPGVVVEWNGRLVSAIRESAQRLRFTIPGTWLSAAQPVRVRAVNPRFIPSQGVDSAVLPATAPRVWLLGATSSFEGGERVVTAKLTVAGSIPAYGLVITGAQLDGAASTSLPISFGHLAPGRSAVVQLRFPGQSTLSEDAFLTLSGTRLGGTWQASRRIFSP
jgi:hypothetical protein